MLCTSCGNEIGAKLLERRPSATVCSRCVLRQVWFGDKSMRAVDVESLDRLVASTMIERDSMLFLCQFIISAEPTEEQMARIEAIKAKMTPAGQDAFTGFLGTMLRCAESTQTARDYAWNIIHPPLKHA